MTTLLERASATAWLGGARVRAYNPTLALLSLLVPTLVAIPVAAVDAGRFWPVAMALVVGAVAMLLMLARHATRGLRLNNGAVALMTRGEEVAAAGAFKAVVRGFFGRDVVGMSLHNLGVLALRALDLPSAIALQRAALDVGRGFRFRWQPSLPSELARVQLAFALAASGEGLDEAEELLRRTASDASSPIAIAFGVRARALVALRRGRLEEAAGILAGEQALLRNVLPLNDAVLCDAMFAHAARTDSYRGSARAPTLVLADEAARAYVRRIAPEVEGVLVEG